MRTTSDQVELATRLRRATTSLAARARAERGGELTLTQVAVLGRIATHGPITPREVAAALRMVPQSLTRPLAALERRSLVARLPDPTDGRGALLEITRNGLQALHDEMAPRDQWLATTIDSVCTDDDVRTLDAATAIMQRLIDAGGGIAPVEP